jgi:hypothetical protein
LKGRVDVKYELGIIVGLASRKRRVKRKIISAESSRRLTRE